MRHEKLRQGTHAAMSLVNGDCANWSAACKAKFAAIDARDSHEVVFGCDAGWHQKDAVVEWWAAKCGALLASEGR